MIDILFFWAIKWIAITLVILGAACLLLRVFKQPVERISLIKISLGSLFVAVFVASMTWLPKIDLGVFEFNASETKQIAKINLVEPKTSPSQKIFKSSKPQFANHASRFSSKPAQHKSETVFKKSVVESVAKPEIGGSPIATIESTSKGTLGWLSVGKIAFLIALLCGSLFQLACLVCGYWNTRKLLSATQRLSEANQARVRAQLCRIAKKDISHVVIRSSRDVAVPIVFGIFRPCIVVPESCLSESGQSTLDQFLAHEWKHVDRRDLFIWGAMSWCQPVLWVNPFYWQLRRELRVCQDQVADEFAATVTNERADYAATLVEFAKAGHPTLMGALSMSGNKSNLYRRVEMLLKSKEQILGLSRRKVVLGLVTAMVGGSMFLASIQWVKAIETRPPAGKLQPQEEDKKASSSIEEATESREWTGFVLDKNTREPLANAEVKIRRENSKTRKVIRETVHTTDENGKYSFVLSPEEQNERYLYIEVYVSHETHCSMRGFGYAYSMIVKNEKLGEPPFFSELLLSPAESVFGRVIDEDGQPAAGIEVSGYSQAPQKDEFSFEVGSFDKVYTDENGKFKMNFAKDGNSILWVQPENYAMQQIITGIDRGDLGDIQLEKGFAICGKIVDARGNPVPNVWVEMDDQNAQREIQIPVASSLRAYAKTDAEGFYKMQPMRASNYRLKVQNSGPTVDENGNDYWERVEMPGVFSTMTVELTDKNADQEFNIQGVPHVYVSGQFLNSKGEPTGGHMPHLFGQFNEDYQFVEAIKGEAKGEFYAMVPHGMKNVKISFSTNEHSALKMKRGQGELTLDTYNVDLGTIEQDVDDITIVRYVAPILQIRVEDEDGNHLPEARVGILYANGEGDRGPDISGFTTSVFFEEQKDGYHRSSQLCPDTTFEYFAELDGFERGSKEMTMKEGATEKVTLVLKKGNSKNAKESKSEDKMKMKEGGEG